MLKRKMFQLTEDGQPVEGYTDESTWNGWARPIFTANKLRKVFHPYKVQFSFTDDCIPVASVEMEDGTEIMESSPIWDEDRQEFLFGYAPEGFCFVEVE